MACQRLDPQTVTLAVEPIAHASAVMRGQPVPDQHHRSVLLELMQLGEELDERFVVVGARTQLDDEMRVGAIGFVASAPARDTRFQLNRWFRTGVRPRRAQIARTDGNTGTPDSSSNT